MPRPGIEPRTSKKTKNSRPLVNVEFRPGQTGVYEAVSGFFLKIPAFYCINIPKIISFYQNHEKKGHKRS